MMPQTITHYRSGSHPSPATLVDRYRKVRDLTVRLTAPLSAEDQQVQSMPDVSPTKWHLAHVTWFFETFLLKPFATGYQDFHPGYCYLFNSYYEAIGSRHARPERGLLTRPSLDDVLEYRAHVDAEMTALIERDDTLGQMLPTLETGLHHEQQHQELALMDIKHVLSRNPLDSAYRRGRPEAVSSTTEIKWLAVPGGQYTIGHDGQGFCFDNETPAHRVIIDDFSLASRLVTNGEFLEFVEDGGYSEHSHWHADGWMTAQADNWSAPLYWRRSESGEWMEFTLSGVTPLRHETPVCHLSFYEAAAYASWAGSRLPTEQEWEVAALLLGGGDRSREGKRDLMDGAFAPKPARASDDGLQQMDGELWQWTQSAYLPYPGFKPPQGAIGEYNGKFMVNQMVLRGGSCVTPPGHSRTTYRNFFYPGQRWMFSGLRLAR